MLLESLRRRASPEDWPTDTKSTIILEILFLGASGGGGVGYVAYLPVQETSRNTTLFVFELERRLFCVNRDTMAENIKYKRTRMWGTFECFETSLHWVRFPFCLRGISAIQVPLLPDEENIPPD